MRVCLTSWSDFLNNLSNLGVYIPTLASLIIQNLQSNVTLANWINFRGIMIGNGYVSKKWDVRRYILGGGLDG
jgi:hypothetical protein